jgi:hypothetical protein
MPRRRPQAARETVSGVPGRPADAVPAEPSAIVQQLVAPFEHEYQALLEDLKGQIRAARTRAALAASQELLLLYWDVGQAIRTVQEREGWGAKVIDRLAADLRAAFPETAGFSPRNLKYMRAFAQAYTETWCPGVENLRSEQFELRTASVSSVTLRRIGEPRHLRCHC